MEKATFINEIENILHENGAIRELQTKIRSELIEILLNKRHAKNPRQFNNGSQLSNLVL